MNDGVKQYSYDSANRLYGLVEGEAITYYAYNGLGDRVQQTVDGETATYILDLNSGLTQVLNDGTKSYVYGLDLISQRNGPTEEFLLRDGLGSIRQVAELSSAITMFKSYEPYDDVLSVSGDENNAYGFAGEWTDASGMQYLLLKNQRYA